MINNETIVEYRIMCRHGTANDWYYAYIKLGKIFNFDAIRKKMTKEQEEFINSLNYDNFTRIPKKIADPTNYQNFKEEIKLVLGI